VLSRALWALGYPTQAAERMAAGLALAEELGHPQSLVIARYSAAQIHQLRGEAPLAHQRSTELIELADEYGLRLWSALGTITLGWAEAELGNAQQGIARMQQGTAAYEATGARLWLPYFLGLLAHQFGKAERVEEGLTTIYKAITHTDHSGEEYSLAELYRIKGELMMKCCDAATANNTPGDKPDQPSSMLAQAQSSFEQALVIARNQQGKSWELRINTSIDYHARRRRKPPTQLTEIYSFFTEGHDTADLKRARAILNRTS
jgi:predicted ATPase